MKKEINQDSQNSAAKIGKGAKRALRASVIPVARDANEEYRSLFPQITTDNWRDTDFPSSKSAVALQLRRKTNKTNRSLSNSRVQLKNKIAIFAGGCFWCNEAAFDATSGVIETTVGYTGDAEVNPTYEQVHGHQTGHREAVKVLYNPDKISFKKLIEAFWRQIDPTDEDGQFYDREPMYTTAIFYSTPEEKKIAETSKKELEKSKRFNKKIATQILPIKPFYIAEEEHQKFYKKRVLQYQMYKKGSGRETTLKEIWK